MDLVSDIVRGVVSVTLEAAPWLLVGLVAAGLVRALMPTRVIARWLGGRGPGPVTLAAVVGAPLPLCSCGVLPVAMGLRKGGASKGATASFLVATPETGFDSIALSYALLGPFFTVVRPIAAVISAVVTGLAVTLTDRDDHQTAGDATCTGETPVPLEKVCCRPGPPPPPLEQGCCAAKAVSEPTPGCGTNDGPPTNSSNMTTVGPAPGMGRRLVGGLAYSFTQLLTDIAPWLAVGLVFAGVMRAVVEPGALASLSGVWAMLAALVAGVPLYICASASTPVAAGLLASGVAPGVALVLLLAGPATNIGSIGVIRKAIGARATAVYVGMIALMSFAAGLATDAIVSAWDVNIMAQIGAGGRHVPQWLALASTVVLGMFSVWPVVTRLTRLTLARRAVRAGGVGRAEARG